VLIVLYYLHGHYLLPLTQKPHHDHLLNLIFAVDVLALEPIVVSYMPLTASLFGISGERGEAAPLFRPAKGYPDKLIIISVGKFFV
jgi:hypothetical protein